MQKEKVENKNLNTDSAGAKIARFALGSVFGIVFLAGFIIMLAAALKGPDTIKVDGVTAPAGLVTGQAIPANRLQIGDRAPDFVLNQLGGEPIQLSKLLAKGNVVIINFWASWCEPCVKEMPDLNSVYLANKNSSNVAILTVNYREDESQAKSFFKNNNLTMPILMDKEGKVAGGYKVPKFPETYFIDAKGIVRELSYGELTKAQFEEKLQTTLKATASK